MDRIIETLVRSHRFRKTIEEYSILQLIGDRVGEQGYVREDATIKNHHLEGKPLLHLPIRRVSAAPSCFD